MKTTKILYALCLVLISVFLLSLTWEFVLEDRILPLFIDGFDPEPAYERWEYVISATLFAALALVVPALLLIESAARLRRLHAELEIRVEKRTRELRHQLDVRKQMEAQVVEARDKAQVASAAKTLFLANISHELRTPMSAVIGMSDVLGQTTLSAEQQHYVATIYKSGTAFLDIINGLLDLTMIESGRFTPRDRGFELHAVVEAMLDMLAYRACQRGLELLSLVDEDVPGWLRGDALALRQILLNLLGNAIKFTEHGVVDLRVSVAAHSPRHCRLRFAVRDTGPGMSTERQTELFRPFTHNVAAPRRRVGGVGLGLSICKSLIESMQGAIGVESVPGEGSLFWCEVDYAIGTITEGETAPSHLIAGRRGLVVDDNPLARSTLQSQLEMLGARAEAVGGATEALEALRRAVADGDPCAFALVDVDMPGIDGLSLAYAIKSDQALAATRLLMLTAVDTPITSKTQQRVGFELQCPKPIRQSQLPDTLRTLMDGQQPAAEDELAARAVAGAGARPLRVLVVEDQPVNQELMQLMLRPLGCEVTLTSSAEEALDLLRERVQDVVFMDCLMPGMDGYAATAAIRRREPDDRHVVIIAMTALIVEGERERCLAAGMDDFLSKPVSEAILKNTLRRWFPGEALGDEKSGASAIADGDVGAAFRQMQEAAGPEAMARLVDLFLDNTAGGLAAMRETLEQEGDKHELAKQAHALKGACLQLGMARMADLCGRLEDAGGCGDGDVAEAALMVQLSEAFEQTSTELEALKARAAQVG